MKSNCSVVKKYSSYLIREKLNLGVNESREDFPEDLSTDPCVDTSDVLLRIEVWEAGFAEFLQHNSPENHASPETLTQFIDETYFLARLCETYGLNSTPLIQFYCEVTKTNCDTSKVLPALEASIRILLGRLVCKLQPIALRATLSTSGNSTASPAVRLMRGKPPIVCGKSVDKITVPQENVVLALLDAGDTGLKKDDLVRKSGHEDAVNILKRLRSKEGWQDVIQLAGKSHGRYRIVSSLFPVPGSQ